MPQVGADQRQQVRRQLMAITDGAPAPDHVTITPDPEGKNELLAKAIVHPFTVNDQRETLEPAFADTHMIDRNFNGPHALVVAGDFGLYIVDTPGQAGWSGVGYPDLLVTPALYEDMRDWQDWETPPPDAQRFVFRLSIRKTPDSDEWLLMLLGLPIDENGLAVRDRIVNGILTHSPHVDPAVSVLGRDTSKPPIPAAWKQ